MGKCYGRLCGLLDAVQSPLLLVMRLYWGWHFFIAGKGKLLHLERATGFFTDLGIPFPSVNAVVVGGVECLCGLLLMAGLFARLAAIPLAIVMAVAYATAHREAVTVLVQSIQGLSFNLDEIVKQEPFPFLITVLVVMAFGPGKFAVDYFLKKKYNEGPL